MRTTLFGILASLLLSIHLSAQKARVLTEVNFFSQADVDNFPINYPGCTTIEGSVNIYSNTITNLNGLSGITAIGGTLNIANSNVNEPASHGFFSFTIDQKPELPNGTYFENTAAIIFDFNPPIVTNTVRHTIGQLTVRVDEAQPYANLWAVWGNPLHDAATFRTETFIAGEKRFDLYDATGRQLRSAQFSGQEFEFRRDGLASGLYFFRISDARGRVFAGKMVVSD